MKRINHHNARIIMWSLFAIGLLIGAALGSTSEIWLAVGTLFFLAGVAVFALFWRCPHCGANLGRDGGKFCPHCGKEL